MTSTTADDSFLARAVRILEAFEPGDTALGVSEISRRTGLHVATASRIVAGLVSCGLLVRDAERRCRIALRTWEIALRASPTLALRETAMPFMEQLHALVGHHVQLSVRHGTEVLFVERLSSRRAVLNRTQIASRLPLHVSSSGQVLLAYGPSDLQAAVLSGPLRRFTTQTITSPTVLRSRLADIRNRGFAVCPGHLHAEAQSLAAPIRMTNAATVASVSIVWPNGREVSRLVPELMATARAISRALESAPVELSEGLRSCS